jgi:polysaccharide deacetylase family protein (PEP-CTERM system associated)
MVNAMTVDVEDYFQVSAFEGTVRRADWEGIPCRVEANTDRILALFDSHGVKATFFMLGWVAQRYPQLVRRVLAAGHELASHGMCHVRVTTQTPADFRSDVVATKHLLEDIAGVAVRGYRAASYSIGAGNLWAFGVLEEAGHVYSSSVYPIHHDLYGMPQAPRFSFRPEGGSLLEIPVTTVQLFGHNLPCGGGGFFRFFPYGYTRWAIRRVNTMDQQPGLFYFHPWELDPAQPRMEGIGPRTRFRHYLNLSRMETRLRRLLRDFSWDRMDRVFLDAAPAPS